MSDTTHTMIGVEIYKRLLGYVFPYWKEFLIAIIAMAGFASTDTGFAAIMKPLLDESIIAQNPLWIKWLPVGIVLIFVLRAVSNFISQYLVNWVGRRVIKDLREEMFARMIRMPTRYYDNNSSGIMISRYTFDVEQVSVAITTVITILFKDTLTLFFLLGWMLYTNWMLTLVFLVVGPVVVWLVSFVTHRFRMLSKKIQDSMGNITHVTGEVIEGHRVVKIFGGQAYEEKNFKKANEFNRQQRMKFEATRALSDGVIQLVIAAGFSAVVIVATLPSVLMTITPGGFVSMMMALMLLQRPVKRLTTINSHLQRGIAAGEKIFEFLDSVCEKDTGSQALPRATGRVEFEDVSFAYDGEKGEVLHDVSFTVEAGKTIALVGRSGSGKSTLASLLARFYNVEHGVIRLDGHDIRDIRLEDLRNNIALVTQHVTLFNDTIANNIAYGALNAAPDKDIRRAADLAHVSEFVDQLPDGMDTMVGENGVKLSGGQRQRLAIARALLKDAPILILDEATSALDTESERYIQSALDELIVNRTTFVIAHRLSTIENADHIIVMHEGRIVEQGSHSQLLGLDGHYANLYRLQFREPEGE